MTDLAIEVADPKHRAALNWFAEHVGQEIAWPEPLDGMFLVNKAKGIHKPAGLDYALSIRQSLSGPYEDSLHSAADGSWFLEYAHEGQDPNYFTNRAMRDCMRDKVPVGVLIQVKEKPDPRYKVLGLGRVTGDERGIFTIQQFGEGSSRADAAIDVCLPTSAFDAANDEDGRKRAMRAIALRRGQPAFRKMLMAAYGGRCAVSGCAVPAVLEAAHIIPYMGDHTNHVQNGLLLRADLHTLFDLGLIRIRPEQYRIELAPELAGTEYLRFDGRTLALPADKEAWPSIDALRTRLAIV